jgi:hypothetical protein
MRLEALHTIYLKSFIVLGLGCFGLLVTALLLGDRDSVDRDGTVFSPEIRGLFNAVFVFTTHPCFEI